MTSPPRVAVIGAGPSGLAAAKNLLQVGLCEVVVFERRGAVGGNWNATPSTTEPTVFADTRLISSRDLSRFEDHPFPPGTPDYPGRQELAAYFESYAERFGLLPLIRFETSVERVERAESQGWRLTLAGGESSVFDAVFVANGHHRVPRLPAWPGHFDGRLMHSTEYWDREPLRDQRVLVVGGGNSACDVAVEASTVASRTAISLRRGYHYVPRTLFGRPSDTLLARVWRLPPRLLSWLSARFLARIVGRPESFGLPRPDHRLFESHPVINSELPRRVRSGRVEVRPDVEAFDGQRVHFVDGTSARFDTVVACTGFEIRFPFLDRELVDFERGPVPLYLRTFLPRLEHLFFIGLVQPMGSIWPLSDLQSRLAANLLVGRYRLPPDAEARAEAEGRAIVGRHVDSPRHTLEVDYHRYRRRLLREMPRGAPS